MKICKRTLNKQRIIIFLCLFPYLEPAIVTGIPDILFNIGKIVSFVYCVWMIFNHKQSRKHCGYIKYIIVFYLIYIVNTYVNNGQTFRAFVDGITVIGFCLIFCVFAFSNKRKLFYQVAYDFYSLFLFINIVSVILYPGGISALDVYFLGHDDTLLYWIIPYILFSYMYQKHCKGKTAIMKVCVTITVLSFAITKSISGIVSVILFAFVFVIVSKCKRAMIATNIGILLLNVGLVVFRIQNMFSFVIEGVFRKSVGLTGRDKIWDRVLYWIKQKPFMGYGYESNDILLSKFMLTDGSYFQFAHCHNYLLQIIYTMGILGLLCFFAMYFISWNRMFRHGADRWNRIIASSLLTIMFSLLVNSYQQPIALFMLLVMGYEISKVEGIFNEIR